MSKRTTALTLALATVAVVLLWRWWMQRNRTIEVPGMGRVRLEPDKRKRDTWQAWIEQRVREADNGRRN